MATLSFCGRGPFDWAQGAGGGGVDVITEVGTLVSPVLAQQGVELVDIEYRRERPGWVLRLFLDKAGGVTLADCSAISGQVSRLLDVAGLIPQSYVLEVSSPGINRRLKKVEDFVRFKGERAAFSLYAPLDGQRHFQGTIHEVQGDQITVREESGKTWTVAMGAIAKAHLDPDIHI